MTADFEIVGRSDMPVEINPSPIVVRAAKPADSRDIDRLVELACIHEGTPQIPLPPANRQIFVAECHDGKIVGIAVLLLRADAVGMLSFLYVESEFCNKKIGSRLLEAVVGVCPKIGLLVKHNNPAIRLYERFGFVYGAYTSMQRVAP
jgi:GNAT superfamily N-acetyltransferase